MKLNTYRLYWYIPTEIGALRIINGNYVNVDSANCFIRYCFSFILKEKELVAILISRGNRIEFFQSKVIRNITLTLKVVQHSILIVLNTL